MPRLLISIFVMAGVDRGCWEYRPDYFRVQAGVNFLPLDLFEIAHEYSAYSDKNSKPLPDLAQWADEEAAIKKIKGIYEEFRLASISVESKKKEFARRHQQDEKEYKSFEAAQWAQYNLFITQRTAPFAEKVRKIAERMQGLLTASKAKSPDDLKLEARNEYYTLNVDHARAELERAKAESEAREYGMRHLTDFQNQPPQQEFLARSREVRELQKSLFDEETSTFKLHGRIYDAFVEYRRTVGERLGYWDFLYFSVGAATTATFGDISPNATPIRMLVCLQVLLSIITTGLVVNDLASGNSKAAALEAP